MTPSLIGRLHSRILLNFVIVLPFLILFNFVTAILIMLPVGLLLETFYDYLQQRRWDEDWPLIFVFISGVLEGIGFYLILDWLSEVEINSFVLMYSLIWSLSFVLQAGLLNILFPYRRFKGGRIL